MSVFSVQALLASIIQLQQKLKLNATSWNNQEAKYVQ